MVAREHERYYRWRRREMVGTLSFWAELWLEADRLAGYDEWRALADQKGRTVDNGTIRYYMTRTLLDEVLYAAGGVETELIRLEADVEAAQRWTDDAFRDQPSNGGGNTFSGAPSLQDAFYAFTNLLFWARAVEERTDRVYKRGSPSRTGLLPALAPGELHDRVAAALRSLKRDLAETRWMANFALHAGPLPGGGSPSALVGEGGLLRLRLPNRLKGRITTWEEFSYSENRDMVTFAREVMTHIEDFVEEVLTAFEDARPERAGPLR